MVSLSKAFWNDEAGFLISSELVIVATMLVVGLVVGYKAVQAAVVGELRDVGNAIGSLNQSYGMTGFKSYHRDGSVKAFSVGSAFIDREDKSDFVHPHGHEHGHEHGHRHEHGEHDHAAPGQPRREPIDEARPLPNPSGKSRASHRDHHEGQHGQAHKGPHGHRGTLQHPPFRGQHGYQARVDASGRVFIPGIGWLGCDKSRGGSCVQPYVTPRVGSPKQPCVEPTVPQQTPRAEFVPEMPYQAEQYPIEPPLPVYPPQPPTITIPIVDSYVVPQRLYPTTQSHGSPGVVY